MIRQLKLAMKLIKYAYGIKMNLAAMGLIGGMGIVLGTILGRSSAQMQEMAFFFLALMPMFVVQIWYSMNSCELLRSSAWKKAADTSIPTLLSFFGILAMYTVTLAVMIATGGANDGMQMVSMLWMAISAFLIMLLCGACFKYFIASMVVFFLFYFSGSIGLTYLMMTGSQAIARIRVWELPAGSGRHTHREGSRRMRSICFAATDSGIQSVKERCTVRCSRTP